MQKYILQVASSGKADWNKRYEKSNENQLNKEHSYCDLQPNEIAQDIISLIDENIIFIEKYENIKQQVQTEYKVLLIGVGPHNNGEISLYDEKGNNKGNEIAQIDKEPFEGKRRMNRLFLFKEKPEQLIFCNNKLDKQCIKDVIFENDCATLIIDFDE